MSGPHTPRYFTGVHHPGILPAVPTASSLRPLSVNPANVRREIALGNYEIARKQAEVADYNNPLDALQAELAIAAQEKAIQEEEEREQRRARRQAGKLARALRHLRVEERRSKSKSRSRGSRKATPYASEISASSSEAEGGQHSGRQSSADRKARHTRRRSRSIQATQKSEDVHDDDSTRIRAMTTGDGRHPGNDGTLERHVPERMSSLPDSTRATIYTSSKSVSTGTKDSRPAAPDSQEDDPPSTAAHHRAGPLINSLGQHNRPHSSTASGHEPPIEPDRELLHLIFPSSEEFVLTFSELVRGGPSNSFLSSWKRFPRPLEIGEQLTVNMPADRDAKLFQIIHQYLRGNDIIPLNKRNSLLLCGEYPATLRAYKTLCKEAARYGIKNLADEIKAFHEHRGEDPDDQSRVVPPRRRGSGSRHGITVRDYANPTVNLSNTTSSPVRAVVTGAAINFMTRILPSSEVVVIYSLVAPLTASAQAFEQVKGCVVDDTSRQLFIEGALTREECRNILLDIMYREVADSSSHSPQIGEVKRRPFTLEHLYTMFMSSQRHRLPSILSETFVKQTFEDDKDMKGNSLATSDHSAPGTFYFSLPYCTVAIRIDQGHDQSATLKIVFEQIHTATQRMLFTAGSHSQHAT
ncbi:hypothetical protein P389DRAFT_17597 [Cystobasidium minutum MCA 4210]|uniref:uncharacterized protein n=1 Tax=Cystobasidium minutum MCA 4210 TaxID=1397322 RepID=UPI0034CD26F9|eukprot:jgi/Rhomi1/17597/CE17596_1826